MWSFIKDVYHDKPDFDEAGVQAKYYGDILAIRGTEKDDWLRNWPTVAWYDNFGTFKGYLDAAFRLSAFASRARIVCGHSQGGAIAVALAGILHFDKVVTFGAPRSVHKDSTKPFPNVIRVVRRLDLIPDLPKGPWKHVGTEAYFTDAGHPSTRWWGDEILRRIERILKPDPLRWHSAEVYSRCYF